MANCGFALIGFMGTGKSSVAKMLSTKLNLELIDTDDLIESKFQMSISEFFSKYGEEKFRKIEKDLIQDISSNLNSVIACGGGVSLNNDNITNLKINNKIILLNASSESIFDRLKTDNTRPILKSNMDVNTIRIIKTNRKESYNKSADIIIDTDSKTISEITDEIIGMIVKG